MANSAMSIPPLVFVAIALHTAFADTSCPVSLLQTGVHTISSLALSFEDYVLEFNRKYTSDSDEYTTRFGIFQKHFAIIQSQNAKPRRLWTAGLNDFADRSTEELASLRGWRRVASHGGDSSQGLALLSKRSHVMKAEVDWRNLSMAKDVPDQGACGSCWAVATAAMLEARYEVQMKKTRSFSAQQLVNCVPNPGECGGNGGCGGATAELAMAYVKEMGLEENNAAGVPYAGKDMTCSQPLPPAALSSFQDAATSASSLVEKKLGHSNGIGMHTWYKLPSNQASPLMAALADGPVAISAAADGWMLYQEGIFDSCPNDAVVDHAIVLFGYGVDDSKGTKYWLVRNSWGASWGENGYIRLLRHETPEKDDDHCGIDHDPGMGIACKPYPEEQRVCGMCGMLFDSVAAHFA